MPVQFNAIPANLRVPLFYAEINPGKSPYQGPSRLLLIGQKLNAALGGNPIRLDGDPQALSGAGSQLAEMGLWGRQNHPFGEIWLLPLADPAGAKATTTITIGAGIAGNAGTLTVYLGGERVQVAVTGADAAADVAAHLAAAIGAGYWKFDRPMAFPVDVTVAGAVVTLTAKNAGTLGNFFAVDKDLVGDEGPLAQYITIAAGTAGTGVPALGPALAILGDMEFDWIASPYSDVTSLDTLKTFLDGQQGRWSPLQQLYGHHLTVKFDTMANLAAFGATRNDPNASILGVANSPSPPWRWAAALGGAIAKDKNLGSEVDQAYRISQPVQTLQLVGILPPKNRADCFSIVQRNQLYQDGIAGYTVQRDGTVALDRVVTTYQTNAYGNPDITWLDVETRAQMVYFVRYMRQRITGTFGRMALADDNPGGQPGIVTPKIIKAECVHAYKEMELGGLVENSTLFAQGLVVERSTDPSRVNAYMPGDVVNQFRIFAANVTTFLQYPA